MKKQVSIFWKGFALGGLSLLVLLTLAALYVMNVGFPVRDRVAGEYQPVIHIQSAEDILHIREQLIQYIFGTGQLPGTLPDINDSAWLVKMENGFISRVRQYDPDDSNQVLVIYHAGHDGHTIRDEYAIQQFVKNGYAVWSLDMPLIGENSTPVTIQHPVLGEILIASHEQFAFLDDVTSGSPVRYFLEPVVALVNTAEIQGYQDIFMVGLSGGGWTTTLAAAIDPRIDASYPAAGSVPLGLRFDHDKNWGDWEQVIPELYQIASYEDLYILGAHQRSQIQVLNEYDLCCFDEPRHVLYEREIRPILRQIGGNFEVYWDEGEFIHWISPSAIEMILQDMQARRSGP